MAELVVRPDPSPESTSVDGQVARIVGTSESISTIRAGAGNGSSDAATTVQIRFEADAVTSNEYIEMIAAILLFDISALPTNAKITAASFEIKPSSAPTTDWDGDVRLVSSNPASNTAIANTDYDTADFGTENYMATPLIASDFVNGVTEVILLSTAGIAFVQAAADGASIVKLGLGFESFINGSTHGTWAASNLDNIFFHSADATGTANDPLLRITYHVQDVVDESLNMVETILGLPGIAQVISEAVNMVETIVDFPVVYQVIDQALNLVETIIGFSQKRQVIDESLNMVETIVHQLFVAVYKILEATILPATRSLWATFRGE